MKSLKKTQIMLRVFFVVACLSLVGIFVEQHKKFTTEVKVQGGSFTEGLIGSPRFINPALAQSETDRDLTRLIFGSLYSPLEENQEHIFTENIELSEDKKTYTLELKKGIRFSDGTDLSADDVLFTIEKIQDPLIKSPLYVEWEGVRAEKINDYTLELSLEKVYVDFLYNLNIGILPKNLWENISPEEFIFSIYNTNPIGAGPYKVTEIRVGEDGISDAYVLSANNHNKKSYIKNIVFKFFDNQEARIEAYNESLIDAAYGVSITENKLSLKKSTLPYDGMLPRVFGIFFNQNKNTDLKNKNVRKAILHSIDQESIQGKVFNRDVENIEDFIGTKSSEDFYSPETAEELLTKSGWKKNEDGMYAKNGKILQFSLSIPNTKDLKFLGELIQNNLIENGIMVDLKIFDQGDLTQNVIRPRDYEAILFGYILEKESDLYAFWHSSQKNDPGLNISLYNNTQIDKALSSRRTKLENFDGAALAETINSDIPAIFLYSPNYTYLLPKDIKSVDLNITHEEDRFASISDWYINTRNIWNIFIR